jgi:hypothetical protein
VVDPPSLREVGADEAAVDGPPWPGATPPPFLGPDVVDEAKVGLEPGVEVGVMPPLLEGKVGVTPPTGVLLLPEAPLGNVADEDVVVVGLTCPGATPPPLLGPEVVDNAGIEPGVEP